MSLVIPGFAARFDFDVIRAVAPRPEFEASGLADHLEHLNLGNGHARDGERFSAIVTWISEAYVVPS